jgi:hypothetical protein
VPDPETPNSPTPAAQTPPTQDDAIRALVSRLARPGRDDGHVIERAAILAAGSESTAIEAWILAHAGRPEPIESTTAPGGLHGDRQTSAVGSARTPRRFLLPAGVL